jgi:hypothetical protein
LKDRIAQLNVTLTGELADALEAVPSRALDAADPTIFCSLSSGKP